MNRITISVTPEIEQAIKREARRQACSVSSVAREALSHHLHLVIEPGQKRKIGFAAIGAGGQPGIAHRIDEVLDKGWGAPDFDRDS
jgi:hypothetical protein